MARALLSCLYLSPLHMRIRHTFNVCLNQNHEIIHQELSEVYICLAFEIDYTHRERNKKHALPIMLRKT